MSTWKKRGLVALQDQTLMAMLWLLSLKKWVALKNKLKKWLKMVKKSTNPVVMEHREEYQIMEVGLVVDIKNEKRKFNA